MIELFQVLKDFVRRREIILSWVMISLAVGVSGPFGTYVRLDLPVRLLVWSVLIGLSMPLAYSVRYMTKRHLPDIHVALRDGVSVVVFSVLYTALLCFLLAQLDRFTPVAPMPLWQLFLIVLMIATVVQALRRAASGSGEPADEDPNCPPLLLRLPEHQRVPILAVSALDHYVRVITETGSHEILMRFSDAIRELEGVEGLRVHRSHWVARHAVAASTRRKGRHFLTLVNGEEIPVSRGHLPDVDEAGLI